MTNRVSYAPQDFQKMCKQAERDQESKKLVVLMERVKRQIAEREHPGEKKRGKTPGGECGCRADLFRSRDSARMCSPMSEEQKTVGGATKRWLHGEAG